MNQPPNRTAWVDRLGDTWVRYDEYPGRYGSWWPLTDGPGWEPRVRAGVGIAQSWESAEDYGPFEPASQAKTDEALERIRRQAES